MRSESTERPQLVERYKSLIRINLGVEEDTSGEVVIYRFYMVELRDEISYEGLVEMLIREKFTIADQLEILSVQDARVEQFLEWRQECRMVARQVLQITETVESVKEDKLFKLKCYDKSLNVDSFTINGNVEWFDSAKRLSIKNGVESGAALGREVYTIVFNGWNLELPNNMALRLLAQLECYAVECFNVTESHKLSISRLETIEEVNSYDYTKGYPDKLNIEVPVE